jgi:hypothetical protein
MSLPAQTFNDITPADFDKLVAAVKSKLGIEISGLQGQASGSTPLGEITIQWDYYPDSEALTLQCLKKPLLLGAGYVNIEISALVTDTLAAG